MKISEQPVEAAVLEELANFSGSVYTLLPASQAPDAKLAVVVDQALYEWQQSGAQPIPDLDSNELIYALGFAWADTIVKEHNWRWTNLVFHEFDDWTAMAVVSQDGSLSILPFAYIHECLAGEDEVKIGASLAALSSNLIPVFAPSTYENVMHGLQRILPRG